VFLEGFQRLSELSQSFGFVTLNAVRWRAFDSPWNITPKNEESMKEGPHNMPFPPRHFPANPFHAAFHRFGQMGEDLEIRSASRGFHEALA
jgi:hypothetical protein